MRRILFAIFLITGSLSSFFPLAHALCKVPLEIIVEKDGKFRPGVQVIIFNSKKEMITNSYTNSSGRLNEKIPPGNYEFIIISADIIKKQQVLIDTSRTNEPVIIQLETGLLQKLEGWKNIIISLAVIPLAGLMTFLIWRIQEKKKREKIARTFRNEISNPLYSKVENFKDKMDEFLQLDNWQWSEGLIDNQNILSEYNNDIKRMKNFIERWESNTSPMFAEYAAGCLALFMSINEKLDHVQTILNTPFEEWKKDLPPRTEILEVLDQILCEIRKQNEKTKKRALSKKVK